MGGKWSKKRKLMKTKIAIRRNPENTINPDRFRIVGLLQQRNRALIDAVRGKVNEGEDPPAPEWSSSSDSEDEDEDEDPRDSDSEDEDEDPRDSDSEDEDEDLSGGEEEEKRFDPLDPTLVFVDGDDELDFECRDFKGPRARMSCGHAATPMSLTGWCRRQLDQGECKFVCGQTDCDAEWPFEEVCKMALLTPGEREYFEKKMFSNAKNYMDIKQCPGCKSLVERKDLNNLNVQCSVCTAAKGRPYRFCWQCLREWKGPGPRSDQCENDGCQNPRDILRTCPEIVFTDVKGVRGCPGIRACPTCGLLLEHTKKQCKSMVCPRCRVKFCFVCLSFSENCLKQNAYQACPTGAAPRQTSIPVWRRR